MGVCQISILAAYFLTLGIALAKHGEYKREKHNFWVTLIANSIEIALLYFGGFFG